LARGFCRRFGVPRSVPSAREGTVRPRSVAVFCRDEAVGGSAL
jgi:hypothetical protein